MRPGYLFLVALSVTFAASQAASPNLLLELELMDDVLATADGTSIITFDGAAYRVVSSSSHRRAPGCHEPWLRQKSRWQLGPQSFTPTWSSSSFSSSARL